MKLATLLSAMMLALTPVACAQTVGRKFLAREVNEPNIAIEQSCTAEFDKRSRTQHQSGSRRVVVIGTTRSHARPVTDGFGAIAVNILHIGRIVMIGHDDRLAAVAARDDDEKSRVMANSKLGPAGATNPFVHSVSP